MMLPRNKQGILVYPYRDFFILLIQICSPDLFEMEQHDKLSFGS